MLDHHVADIGGLGVKMRSVLWDPVELPLPAAFQNDKKDKEPPQGPTPEPRTLAHLKVLLERLREKRRQKREG